jgi:gamma-D-glutamyl-L-lysine dipeptidyl-peptidase
MKNITEKTAFLTLLLFFTVLASMAQQPSYKDFYLNLKDELDLFTSDSTLGDKIWGLTTLSVSNLRSKPAHSSELVSQTTMGTPVKLIEESEGWLRVETPEGYNGWMDISSLKRFSPEEIDLWKGADRYVYNRISGYAFATPNHKGKIVTDLVLDDIFVVEDKKLGYLKILTPDGRSGYVKRGDCISWKDWINKKPDVQSLLAVPRQMVGFPYLWGGTSTKAVDCSGLVKIAYLSQAIVLERDASQQVQTGDSIDFKDMKNLQPCDLLFFGPSPQKIVHVGIYLGNGEFIHASGLIRISSIDPTAQNYYLTAKRNIYDARRILNSLNTEGIVQVKYHPWYSSLP